MSRQLNCAKLETGWVIRLIIRAKTIFTRFNYQLLLESLVMWGGWFIYLSSLGPLRIQIRGWRDRWPQRRPRGSVGPSVRAGPSQTPRPSQANRGSTGWHGCVLWKLKDWHIYINYNDALTGKRFPYYWPCVRGIAHRSLEDSPHKGTVWRSLNVFFVVRLNQLLNKLSNYRWFETTWPLCHLPEMRLSFNWTHGLIRIYEHIKFIRYIEKSQPFR